MHRTDTCDMFTVAYGEIYLVSDTDETLLRPGDTAVVLGVNHAWSNRSDKPCMIIGTMVHANPWPGDKYPPPGLYSIPLNFRGPGPPPHTAHPTHSTPLAP